MTAFAHRVFEVDLPTSLDRCLEAFPPGRGAFLFDGGASTEHDRYALFGAEPIAVLRAYRTESRRGARIVVHHDGGTEEAIADPFDAVRAFLSGHAPPASVLVSSPLPLRAGVVGYFGYECGQLLESLPNRERPRLDLPDVAFFLHDWVLGTCRSTGLSVLSVVGRGADVAEAERNVDHTRARVLERMAAVARPTARGEARRTLAFQAALSDAEYTNRIETAKAHIEAGDSFEICLTNRLEAEWSGAPLDVFRRLRSTSPGPFAAFLDMPEASIVSSSPERFVALDANRGAESRPIKGTRARGRDATEDLTIASELASSEKDRAENAMIVDLVRNDLGKVCAYGSVVVPELYAVEQYATVHQMVSTVRGVLRPDADALDLARACFPPGSMTGAPKIETMTILEALEPVERGVYAGALGWIDASGTMDLSVVIRTAVIHRGTAYVGVGGAIVADSVAAAEVAEMHLKSRAVATALAETP